MEVLTIFYDYKSVNVNFIMQKANINVPRKNEVIELLIIKGFITISDGNFLVLTPKGDVLVGELVPNYKKLRSFYLSGFDL